MSTIKRFFTLLLMVAASALVLMAEEPDSLVQRLPLQGDSVAVARLDSLWAHLDTIDLKDRWKHQVFRHGWSINDTAIVYPKFINFGVKTYRWLNKALNY